MTGTTQGQSRNNESKAYFQVAWRFFHPFSATSKKEKAIIMKLLSKVLCFKRLWMEGVRSK